MISREEITDRSNELSVHPSNIQRDYVFGWLLSAIYGHTELSKRLVLKGGNCFRKAYFEGARYSPDLDFAATNPIDPKFLASQLNQACSIIQEGSEVRFDLSRTRVDEGPTVDADRRIQKARLYFRDFFGEESELVLAVRIDISEFDRIHLPIQTRHLVHQYSDSDKIDAPIRCLKLEELLAAKLKCLLQRRHAADLFDFVNATLLNPVIELDKSELVQTFLRMTIFGKGPGVVKDLLVGLPFQLIHGLWDKYVVCPRNAIIEFDHAVEGFANTVDELFGRLPRISGDQAFFPAEYRNKVMLAGQELTVLRLVYDGVEREVEPYSLMFKTRRDGLAREYFYVYDRTGGRSSAPGLKSLIHPKISAMENTDVRFEPRQEVELSRAGELFGDSVFRGSPGRRLSIFPAGSRHAVECPVCGKRFSRKRFDVSLNPHKDRYGNECYNRVGVMHY
jgi:predicted nucleotidyltransferase component of viral defense system